MHLYNGKCGEKTWLRRFANNKGADQPAHPRCLISVFAIRFLESTISKLTTSEISIFRLVTVAEETGLSLALAEPPRQVFSRGARNVILVITHPTCRRFTVHSAL